MPTTEPTLAANLPPSSSLYLSNISNCRDPQLDLRFINLSWERGLRDSRSGRLQSAGRRALSEARHAPRISCTENGWERIKDDQR